MRPIATVGVAWSVRWSHSRAPQKQLNRSRCPLGMTRMGPRNQLLHGGPDPGEGAILSKALWITAVVYAATKSITASARLLHSAALISTSRCHINFFSVKNPPMRCACRQNSLTTCLCSSSGKEFRTYRVDHRSFMSYILYPFPNLCTFLLRLGRKPWARRRTSHVSQTSVGLLCVCLFVYVFGR